MWEHFKRLVIFVLAKLNTSFYGNKLLFEDYTKVRDGNLIR